MESKKEEEMSPEIDLLHIAVLIWWGALVVLIAWALMVRLVGDMLAEVFGLPLIIFAVVAAVLVAIWPFGRGR